MLPEIGNASCFRCKTVYGWAAFAGRAGPNGDLLVVSTKPRLTMRVMPTKSISPKPAPALGRSLSRLLVILVMATSLGLVACNWVLAAPMRQLAGGPPCQILDRTKVFYPDTPVSYPATSDLYEVQYRINGGTWTPATVHISNYGGTIASPFATYSGYEYRNTSMSSVSIPAPSSKGIELRVTKLTGLAFPPQGVFSTTTSPVAVRPTPKPVTVEQVNGRVAVLSLRTPVDFAGDQFILSYASSATQSSALQGLVFFLDSPLTPPAHGPNVKVVQNKHDMEHLDGIDTLDFESVVGDELPYVFDIPAQIKTVYLGDEAWLRGKIRFEQDGTGQARMLYGHGVIDASRFDYSLRHCGPGSGYEEQGYKALSFGKLPKNGSPDRFTFNGFTITDTNFAATDTLSFCCVNDVKILSWNGNNGGFLLGSHNLLTNIFARDGDDTFMMWGSATSIINATVWQKYHGGVVNLGWGKDSPGESDYIDGLYVVKTDWLTPEKVSWKNDFLKGDLDGQNNAIFDSLMIPEYEVRHNPSAGFRQYLYRGGAEGAVQFEDCSATPRWQRRIGRLKAPESHARREHRVDDPKPLDAAVHAA